MHVQENLSLLVNSYKAVNEAYVAMRHSKGLDAQVLSDEDIAEYQKNIETQARSDVPRLRAMMDRGSAQTRPAGGTTQQSPGTQPAVSPSSQPTQPGASAPVTSQP